MMWNSATSDNAGRVVESVIKFLQLFVPLTLAKRAVSMLLLAVGVPNGRVTALAGLCERSVRSLRQAMMEENPADLFMDAAHFVMGCDFLGYIYCKTRRFIRTWRGRKRYNVLGALDFVTKKVLTVSNDSYITASQVCDMPRLIAREYAGQTVHLVLDNAKYQKCRSVWTLARARAFKILVKQGEIC